MVKVTPQLRLSMALVTLLLSIVFVADFIGLLPRPEEQIQASRNVLGESLAVQLSSAAANGGNQLIQSTLEEIVRRNQDVLDAALLREDGTEVASFGATREAIQTGSDLLTTDDLVVPIFDGNSRWGEARLGLAPNRDWGLRYLGISKTTLGFILFLGAASLLTFYLFMRKALAELNPSKVVPQRVTAAFDVLAEGVLIVDERERIVLANSSLARRIGQDRENMIGKSPSNYQWDLKGDELEELPWQTALKSGEQVQGMPLRIAVDGDSVAFTVNAAPIEDGQGEQKGVLITFDDVTPIEAKNAELANMLAELSVTQKIIEDKNRQLEALATRDPLTGCLNRRSFLEAYEEQHGHAERFGGALALLMVDIDHFKQVNDNHGHIVGDQAIKLVARVLREELDEFGSVGRFGGEEFVVSLPGTSLEEALRRAEQLRVHIAARAAAAKELPIETLTVSIGAAGFIRGHDDHMELIDKADRALYHAKQLGRNRVCDYDPGFTHLTLEVEAVNEAVSSGESQRREDVDELRSQLRNMEQVVRQQAKEITRKSMHDDFTGLPNRFLLQDRLIQALKISDRNDNITAVVCLSLSSYRRVYDLSGHEAAEDLVREAARRVETVVRSVDSIGVAHNERALTFSRIADNELALLLVDLRAVEAVAKVVGRITRALERPFLSGGQEIANDVHCGIALYPHDSREPDLLVRNASLARRYAERRSPHHSNSAYFSRDIDSLAAKNAGIATELRKAMQDNGLRVVYQPKMDPVTGKVTGCEALARWSHPEFGDVSPAEFIAVAENIGMVHQLTDWVLARVCDDIATGVFEGIRVSVNVSPLELHDARTADRILGIIRDKRVPPHQIEIEITESSILDNFELARKILTKLQAAGINVVLDDFGTAFSSLNLLVEIPVDVIKVDRSFVTNVHNAHDNRAVVHAIIHMANAMGKRVVAEGVETVDERDCLMALGCREVQGFLYSKPLTLEDLGDFVAQYGVLDPSHFESASVLELTA